MKNILLSALLAVTLLGCEDQCKTCNLEGWTVTGSYTVAGVTTTDSYCGALDQENYLNFITSFQVQATIAGTVATFTEFEGGCVGGQVVVCSEQLADQYRANGYSCK